METLATKDSRLLAREVAYLETLELQLAELVGVACSETTINRTLAQQEEVSSGTILKTTLNLAVFLEVAQLQALQLHLLEELEEVFLVTTNHRLNKIPEVVASLEELANQLLPVLEVSLVGVHQPLPQEAVACLAQSQLLLEVDYSAEEHHQPHKRLLLEALVELEGPLQEVSSAVEEALAVVAFSGTHSPNQQTQDSVEGLHCLEVLQILKTQIQVLYLT